MTLLIPITLVVCVPCVFAVCLLCLLECSLDCAVEFALVVGIGSSLVSLFLVVVFCFGFRLIRHRAWQGRPALLWAFISTALAVVLSIHFFIQLSHKA